jgi:hypothetical protein
MMLTFCRQSLHGRRFEIVRTAANLIDLFRILGGIEFALARPAFFGIAFITTPFIPIWANALLFAILSLLCGFACFRRNVLSRVFLR